MLALAIFTMPRPTGGLAVEAGQLALVGEAVLDARHVAQAHRRLVAPGDDQLAQLLDLVELQVELDQAFGGAAHHEAAGQLHVLAGEGLADVLGGDLVGGHAVGQQVDPDGAVAPAAQAHLADAVDGLEALL